MAKRHSRKNVGNNKHVRGVDIWLWDSKQNIRKGNKGKTALNVFSFAYL